MSKITNDDLTWSGTRCFIYSISEKQGGAISGDCLFCSAHKAPVWTRLNGWVITYIFHVCIVNRVISFSATVHWYWVSEWRGRVILSMNKKPMNNDQKFTCWRLIRDRVTFRMYSVSACRRSHWRWIPPGHKTITHTANRCTVQVYHPAGPRRYVSTRSNRQLQFDCGPCGAAWPATKLCTLCLKKASKIIFVITMSNFHQIWQFLAQRWQTVWCTHFPPHLIHANTPPC